ncbi:MAG: hypothetical protein WCC76_03450, partial [Candidatus Acidiferrales bacterium]
YWNAAVADACQNDSEHLVRTTAPIQNSDSQYHIRKTSVKAKATSARAEILHLVQTAARWQRWKRLSAG